MVASWLGVAGMAGTCIPLARVFQSHLGQAADARQLAIALAAFAPGLVGYGLTANLSRVLYADGRSRAAALAVSGGWLLVIVADLVIVPFVPRSAVVPWLGAGTTIGLTGSGSPCSCWSAGSAARTRCAVARGPRWPAWPARWPGPPPGSAWRRACG